MMRIFDMVSGVANLRGVFFCRTHSISTEASSSEEFECKIMIDIISKG
jgi:hypothetical protein